MPVPATVPDLLDMIRRSGLIDGEALARVEPSLRSHLTPHEILQQLIDKRLLTPFQAEQLANGRWKGFFLADFRILDKLGQGGIGQVYLAEHSTQRRRVAVKVLATELTEDETILARFAREARAAAVVSHPNIIRVEDLAIDHRPAFLVMEYVPGVSLQATVARCGTFSAQLTASCGRQSALALQAVDEAGLVHRDIKPANLLLTRSGSIKVLDLGIVRMKSDEDDNGLTLTSGKNAVLGTVDYLAPEQAINSHEVDIRADIYGLGGTLYFLLAGHPPFKSEKLSEILSRKQNSDPTPIQELRPDLDPNFAAIIQRMLARSPADRPSPLELAALFEPYITESDEQFLRKAFQPLSTARETQCWQNAQPTPVVTLVESEPSAISEFPTPIELDVLPRTGRLAEAPTKQISRLSGPIRLGWPIVVAVVLLLSLLLIVWWQLTP